MKDRTITCIQCESPFMFNVAEQRRYIESGFNAPRRCPACRKNKSKPVENEWDRKHKNSKKRNRHRRDDEFVWA
jgi:hypothetical protein